MHAPLQILPGLQYMMPQLAPWRMYRTRMRMRMLLDCSVMRLTFSEKARLTGGGPPKQLP